MKKTILLLSLLLTYTSVFAMPVKKGVKHILTLADGTTVEATLHGDEYGHWWQSADGVRYQIAESGIASVASQDEYDQLLSSAGMKRQQRNAIRAKRMAKARKNAEVQYVGEKKGLVILVNFANLTMKSGSTQEVFDAMFNEEGYNKNGHIGSVHDYFSDQSYGKFDLDFDVVGPVTVSNNYSYYGQNDSNGDDKYPCKMVIEALKLADSQVNYADYDWDGDGEVDQVYIIYAGYGENAGASASTIWPHEYELSSGSYYGDGAGVQKLDGVTIDTYAVSCELAGDSGSTLNGIGTACHEFSHCLGYPDFYDTSYSGGWGMEAWDVLDAGSYNGPDHNGEIPAGYTAYERWVAGWLTPTEVNLGDTITNMQPLGDSPEAYIVYNDNNKNEYYMMENRQPDRWFSYREEYKATNGGMLIYHVDYSATAWYNNEPNSSSDHQRMTVIQANNKKGSYMSSYGQYSISASQYAGHLYPYQTNDSLTNESTPAATTYNKNTDGTKYMNKPIRDIKLNSDGTMSFACYNIAADTPGDDPDNPVDPDPQPTGDVIFYESFDKCEGSGGNDKVWNGISETPDFIADNDGWVCDHAYGAYQCARFGTGKYSGDVTSPTFEAEGNVTVSFKAGLWDTSKDGTTLDVYYDGTLVEQYEVAKGEWSDISFTVESDGEANIEFIPTYRFFLDEVKVTKADTTNGINNIKTNTNDNKVYSLSGQYLGNHLYALPAGLYIQNGKKVLKR